MASRGSIPWLPRLGRPQGRGRGPLLRPESLVLVPFFFRAGMGEVEDLGRRLASSLTMEVARQPPGFDPELAYDPRRGQYDSKKLLSELLRCHGSRGRVLGLTDVDLFIPVLTFVFGEALLGAPAAVVSSHRLEPSRYGLPPSRDLLRERLLKEAVHELGHTWSLRHCDDQSCVMASSSVVEAIDLKSGVCCRRCRERWVRKRSGTG